MDEILCYSTNLNANSDNLILSEDESYHLAKVLRFKINDNVFVTNGRGLKAEALVTEIAPKTVKLKIKSIENISPSKTSVHAAVCVLKTREKIELVVEKLTELGVSKISFLTSKRSERSSINLDRLNKIAISAMKQSFGFYLPEINPLQSFEKFVENQKSSSYQKIIAWCGTNSNQHISKVLKKSTDTIFLIGPEGDFSNHEIELATGSGFVIVNLGQMRLRSETAALYVASTIINVSQA